MRYNLRVAYAFLCVYVLVCTDMFLSARVRLCMCVYMIVYASVFVCVCACAGGQTESL